MIFHHACIADHREGVVQVLGTPVLQVVDGIAVERALRHLVLEQIPLVAEVLAATHRLIVPHWASISNRSSQLSLMGEHPSPWGRRSRTCSRTGPCTWHLRCSCECGWGHTPNACLWCTHCCRKQVGRHALYGRGAHHPVMNGAVGSSFIIWEPFTRPITTWCSIHGQLLSARLGRWHSCLTWSNVAPLPTGEQDCTEHSRGLQPRPAPSQQQEPMCIASEEAKQYCCRKPHRNRLVPKWLIFLSLSHTLFLCSSSSSPQLKDRHALASLCEGSPLLSLFIFLYLSLFVSRA